MNKKKIVEKTEKFVKNKLYGEGSGHDWWHTFRVWQIAKNIEKKEKADLFVVELAALLHDIDDWKFQEDSDVSVGAMATQEWLEKLDVNPQIISRVYKIVKDISFKSARAQNKISTIEGKIVQDADRLDAIGAVGISRCFAYSGHMGRQIYDPNIKPKVNQSSEEYKKVKGTGINHFYEKLLLLSDRMNTKTGKLIAKERHKFMEQFLDRFFKEWEGKI